MRLIYETISYIATCMAYDTGKNSSDRLRENHTTAKKKNKQKGALQMMCVFNI